MVNKKTIFLSLFILFQNAFLQSKFLVLMGPSGTGKSTLIRLLKKLDDRFVYVTPLTTRVLRDGEVDKVHASLDEIQRLDSAGELLVINKIYDTYYATPKNIIEDALKQGNFPILDWPVEKWEIMKKNYDDQLYAVYIEPESIEELKRRLASDNRDIEGKRYEAGIVEMRMYLAGTYDHFLNLKIINTKDQEEAVANLIYNAFIASLMVD